MQGTSLTKQERECKLYDEFDKFAYKMGETLREFYLRFSLLLNDMNIYNMKLEQFQVNTKFLNTLPPEWSKFVTNVKLVQDFHTTNVDQLHAYLGQHEFHANEFRLMHERNSDPLALTQQYSTHQSSTPLSITLPSNDYQLLVHHNVYSPSSSIPQLEYAPTVNQQSEFFQPDSGLIAPMFQKGDDPIDAINHMMSFLTAVVTSRYSTTNNQVRNSSNSRQQATINNERLTLQPIQGRQNSLAAGTTWTYTPGASGSNSGKQRTVICYNYKGEGHMSKQCTKPKRKWDDSWFKDKVFLYKSSMWSNSYMRGLAFLADEFYLRFSLLLNDMNIYSMKLEQFQVNTNFLNTLPPQWRKFMIDVKLVWDLHITNVDQLHTYLGQHEFHTNEKAQQLEPKLYDGNVIKNTSAIVIPDSEETLMLAEESHSKMLLKQLDPMMLEKKVNTTPVDYVVLNQLSQDFET
ncbi:hypothetical protein Tco_0624379 [Tanacetum coccineum]|uniref:Integrase, catalytic region, zinc finger, CCHC-type, peptidase aspartic, catalytic n=1 Tax=Tanacetum coccineum TaxID=301880 RepID=A0ABQ4WDQ5_9ASTR